MSGAVRIGELIDATDYSGTPETPCDVEPAQDSIADKLWIQNSLRWQEKLERTILPDLSEEIRAEVCDRIATTFDIDCAIHVDREGGTIAVRGVVDGVDWVVALHHGKFWNKPAAQWGLPLAAPTEPSKPSRFRVQSAQEFAGELKPREWLVEDVVTADAELVAVPGPSRAGKSFILLELAAAIHRGTPWHGRIVKRQRVCYVVAEGAGDFKYRMAAYVKHHGVAMRGMFSVIAAAPNLLKSEQALELATAIRESGGADLIVFDTLSATSAGGDQNATSEMSLYVDTLRQIRQATGASSCWYAHHSGKDEGKGQRGSTLLIGACDTELWVSRGDGDLRTVELTKSKAGQEGRVLTFKLARVALGVDMRGKEFDSCVIESVEALSTTVRTVAVTGKVERQLLDAVRVAPEQRADIRQLCEKIACTLPRTPAKRDNRLGTVGRALRNLTDKGSLRVVPESDGAQVELPVRALSDDAPDPFSIEQGRT